MTVPKKFRPIAVALMACLCAGALADTLDCNGPVLAGDSAKTLLKRLGKDAAVGDIGGAEGETQKGIVLFGKDAKRRLEVGFDDEAMTRVTGVAARDGATGWEASGLRVGSSLAEVAAANGGPVGVNGFEWDYGGYVDFRKGKLAGPKGKCRLSIRLAPREGVETPPALSGERKLSSSDAKLAAFAPVVSELALDFAPWRGTK